MVYNYFLLVVAIFVIFIMIFKIKGNFTFRLLGVVMASDGILICLAKILSIEHILNYPIGFLGIISYFIITNMAWRIRKVPGKKFVAYYWLIGIPLMIVFLIIAIIFFK
jgi:hypothetical protein